MPLATSPGRERRQNAVCVTCHADVERQVADGKHEAARVECVQCHGPSVAHAQDENNEVKPDQTFAGGDADQACRKCHACSRPSADRPMVAPARMRQHCAGCHKAHRFPLQPAHQPDADTD